MDVTRPTVISAAAAGRANTEVVATAPTRRRKLFTRTSDLVADADHR
jgi:hypothetical protein